LRNDWSECRDFEGCRSCRSLIITADGIVPIRLRRDYVMRCLEHADAFIAPSRALADKYLNAGLDPARVHTISNGIDLGAIAPRARKPSAPVRFLFSAYLGEHKGIVELVQALKLLWAKEEIRGRWTMWIAGDGHLKSFLTEQISLSGLASAVIPVGRLSRADLITRLQDSDVVALSSIWPENEPVSLLEGVASGAGLIASRVGGVTEIVEHGVNGLVYDPHDPAALAEAMEQLIVSPRQIEAFSRANLLLRPSIDETRTGAQIDAIYRQPIAGPKLAPPLMFTVHWLAALVGSALIARAPAQIGKRRLRFILSPWAAQVATRNCQSDKGAPPKPYFGRAKVVEQKSRMRGQPGVDGKVEGGEVAGPE
jgi:hypothetical protein